ncbi:MAG TPA: hypothetical protein VMT52_10210 [Planctomycetota bacterium]|nr:hypothetical protein [Planctomycetota bacterium]
MRYLGLLVMAVPAIAAFPCGCAVGIQNLEPGDALAVTLDGNARSYFPGAPLPLKFFVDITNETGRRVDLTRLLVELRVFSPEAPGEVKLRQNWVYRWPQEVVLEPGKRLTVPILPERATEGGGSPELPVELLPEGRYGVVAVVNDHFQSAPYEIRIVRPDLQVEMRRS